MGEAQYLVSATEIKNRFGDCLARVLESREPLLIKRHGHPVAVLVEYRKWEIMLKGEKRKEQNSWIVAYKRFLEKSKKWQSKIRPFSAAELVKKIREEESP